MNYLVGGFDDQGQTKKEKPCLNSADCTDDSGLNKDNPDNGVCLLKPNKYFKKFCQRLEIEQYYNRPHTPKDNPDNERFNQTLQYEFLSLGNFYSDPLIFNQKLTEWLIEYNFRRPHQSLGYQTPLQFSKVLPMYSSCTGDCQPPQILLY